MESIIPRLILPVAKEALTQFRALCITGPRQSGKTTLSKLLYPNKAYVNFENPAVQLEAESDPGLFISKYKSGAVFDEAQRIPSLLRYLQEVLDNNSKRGQFIIINLGKNPRLQAKTLVSLLYAKLQER